MQNYGRFLAEWSLLFIDRRKFDLRC